MYWQWNDTWFEIAIDGPQRVQQACVRVAFLSATAGGSGQRDIGEKLRPRKDWLDISRSQCVDQRLSLLMSPVSA